jgi:serine/threonine-protein kinase HipA
MYDAGWLKMAGAFPLSPTLVLTPGPFQSDKGLFGAFSDAAPDRWGKKLMRHHERERAKLAGTKPRKLLEADFLLGVDDEIRMGALRFKVPNEERFRSFSNKPVPPLIDLKKLLSAADRVEKGKEKKGDLDLLLAPAGSLGGARPKAVIRDKDGTLTLAKFPWKQDDWSVILWEKLTLDLAKDAGIEVAKYRLELKGDKSVLMIARFDRGAGNARIPYMSAMTALGANDHGEERSYLEIVDVLRQIGGSPEQDIQQLWRRVVFNVLVSNTDDHPRNHGLLLGPNGWRLSPAFDMNPSPMDISDRIHIMAINEEDRSGSLDLVLSVADYFGLSLKEATRIAGDVGSAVSKWRDLASKMKISDAEIERIESAFAHDDLEQAVANRVVVATPKETAKRPASPRSRRGKKAA